MKISVIGTGHVGLPTTVAMARIGHQVTAIDADEEKVARLLDGVLPFHEPGLQDLFEEGMTSGRLKLTVAPAEAFTGSEVVFICVGTPPRADRAANLIAVERSARDVARHADEGVVVADKSTVPAGTAKRVRAVLSRERPGLGFDVVSNPEFLREGRAVSDALDPDRILVGAESDRAFEVMRRLYAPLMEKGARLIETDIASAELAKHACNAFLALKISFVNALARLAEQAGGDVGAIAEVMGADPRIGPSFLGAGMGYGGYCFPKDLDAFERLADGLGYDFPLLREIARINDEALEATVAKVEEAVWNLEDKRVAVLGLAYKAETDDIRFSPAVALVRELMERGANVVAYDPHASVNAKAEVPELETAPGPYEAAAGAHCLVLCTNWEEFRTLDLARLKEVMADPVVVDGRNLFDPDAMRAAGFTYYSMGRAPVIPTEG